MLLPACCDWCCNPRHRARSRVVLYFRMHPHATQVHAARVLDVNRSAVSTWHAQAVRRGCVPKRTRSKFKGGVPPAGLVAWPIGSLFVPESCAEQKAA